MIPLKSKFFKMSNIIFIFLLDVLKYVNFIFGKSDSFFFIKGIVIVFVSGLEINKIKSGSL